MNRRHPGGNEIWDSATRKVRTSETVPRTGSDSKHPHELRRDFFRGTRHAPVFHRDEPLAGSR